MSPPDIAAARMAERVGEEVGVSDWIEISQSMIDQFADATMDRQFIHVDPAGAAGTAFGGTVAHGFLLLSLLSRMCFEALPAIEHTAMTVNYGVNRLRFVSPVRAAARVRGRFGLAAVDSKAPDRLLLTYDVTMETDTGPKPALVAQWLVLTVLHPARPAPLRPEQT
jgi:acyl dehydratase